MKTREEQVANIVSDDEIEKAWANADFGAAPKRDVIKFGLLKRACGYHNGHTCDCILKELLLLTDKTAMPTALGRDYLWTAFGYGSGH